MADFLSFLASLGAEDDFVVAANVAIVDDSRLVLVVLGVGVRSGAGGLEGHGSGGGDVAGSVGVVAAISRCACEAVWRLAEAAKVWNRAAGTPAVQTIGRVSSRGVDLQRQVVGVHIAQVIRILAIGADGELRHICLRLGQVSVIWINIVAWESPN